MEQKIKEIKFNESFRQGLEFPKGPELVAIEMEKEFEEGWYVQQIIGPMSKRKSLTEWIVVYRKD